MLHHTHNLGLVGGYERRTMHANVVGSQVTITAAGQRTSSTRRSAAWQTAEEEMQRQTAAAAAHHVACAPVTSMLGTGSSRAAAAPYSTAHAAFDPRRCADPQLKQLDSHIRITVQALEKARSRFILQFTFLATVGFINLLYFLICLLLRPSSSDSSSSSSSSTSSSSSSFSDVSLLIFACCIVGLLSYVANGTFADRMTGKEKYVTAMNKWLEPFGVQWKEVEEEEEATAVDNGDHQQHTSDIDKQNGTPNPPSSTPISAISVLSALSTIGISSAGLKKPVVRREKLVIEKLPHERRSLSQSRTHHRRDGRAHSYSRTLGISRAVSPGLSLSAGSSPASSQPATPRKDRPGRAPHDRTSWLSLAALRSERALATAEHEAAMAKVEGDMFMSSALSLTPPASRSTHSYPPNSSPPPARLSSDTPLSSDPVVPRRRLRSRSMVLPKPIPPPTSSSSDSEPEVNENKTTALDGNQKEITANADASETTMENKDDNQTETSSSSSSSTSATSDSSSSGSSEPPTLSTTPPNDVIQQPSPTAQLNLNAIDPTEQESESDPMDVPDRCSATWITRVDACGMGVDGSTLPIIQPQPVLRSFEPTLTPLPEVPTPTTSVEPATTPQPHVAHTQQQDSKQQQQDQQQ